MVENRSLARSRDAQELRHRTPICTAILGSLVVAITLLSVPNAQARITKVQVTTTESPTFGGLTWLGVGQYEKIAGKAFGEVDPRDP